MFKSLIHTDINKGYKNIINYVNYFSKICYAENNN